jgi:hypothetical protein
MNNLAKIAGTMLVNATLLAASVVLVTGTGTAPAAQPQQPGFSDEQIAQWVDEMVTEQVIALDCSTTPSLTERVAVRNAVGIDRGVVRVVTFDEGWALGTAGKVIVVGWCK